MSKKDKVIDSVEDTELNSGIVTDDKTNKEPIKWEKLKDIFVDVYSQAGSLDKQLNVIENQFKDIIEVSEDIKKEVVGARKVYDDHIKEIIKIYKLHTDGGDKPDEDFTKYKYYSGNVNIDNESHMEAYLAIVTAYTSLEDKFVTMMPIIVGHLVSIISEYSTENNIKLNTEQDSVINTVKDLQDGK